jgi:hypothetical protein
MYALIKIIAIASVCLLPTLSVGQECEELKGASPGKATLYLQHPGDDAAAAMCVLTAFHQIAAQPPQRAIPFLISHLGYKRPLNEAERQGLFMHGNGPNVLYPAVHELYTIGHDAEPALVGWIAQNRDRNGTVARNALYTLLLIHHGNTISVIKELHQAATSSTSVEDRYRLQTAARDALEWCDERSHSQCEDALR